MRNEAGEVVFDKNGQAKLVHADLDIRLAQPDQAPFPLYPGEVLRQVEHIHYSSAFEIFVSV